MINLKLSVRNILKEKRTSLLNLLGLSMGFTFAILILLYTHREFTYDSFHSHADRICYPEFSFENIDGTIQISRNLSLNDFEAIKETVAGIENISFLNYSYFDWDNGAWIEFENQKLNLERMAFSDGNFNNVFSFDVKLGDLNKALEDPNSIVLTESISKKIFNTKNPIGQTVKLNNHIFQVRAVLSDIPQNSSIWFSSLVSYKASQRLLGRPPPIDDSSYHPFLLLQKNVNTESVRRSFEEYFLSTLTNEGLIYFKESSFHLSFIPLKESYFHDPTPYDPLKHGNRTLTFVILFIGVLLLSLAIINFINLSIAGSIKWTKNQAVQKVLGSGLNNELKQLILKSTMLSFGAFAISIMFIQLIVPFFNQLIDYPLNLAGYLNIRVISVLLLLVLCVGLISGMIPGLLFRKLSVLNLMKGDITKGITKGRIWKNLLIFQLVISIALISGSLIIYKQVMFSLNKDLGMTTKNRIVVPVWKLEKDKKAFIDKVEDNPVTVAHCLSSTYLNTFNKWSGDLTVDGENKDVLYHIIHANEDLVPTLGLNVVDGRNFLSNENSDVGSYILNESAKKSFGILNIEDASINGYPIIGVVNDFNIKSIHYPIEPVAIWKTNQKRTGNLTISFTATSKQEVSAYMAFLKDTWQDIDADVPFEYEFLDDRLRHMYNKEISLMKAVLSFSALAIFISCLGLLGLISFITEIRTKEIGIRKVNGAKISEILTMLNRDFAKWVAIAFVIAVPIAWYAMTKWLENFAYKTALSWWIFALAGVLAMGIALLTVSWQSWRAATRNPVEALRYE